MNSFKKNNKEKSMKKYLFVLITATLFTSAYADQPKVYTQDSVVFNRTFSDWSAAWHQWADSMPAKKHPLFDTASCSEGQSGPVWFLGGRFCAIDINPECENAPAVRTCDIPEGVALYFPVLNSACLDAEAANGLCLEAGPFIPQMRKVIADIIDQTTGLQVTVDGERIEGNLRKKFRVQSNVYTSLLPEGNLYQALGEPVIVKGSYVGVGDGVYVMLKPLKKGNHTLNLKGSFPPQFNFSLDFTYNLIVQ
jgi:hypothetical protein